MREIRAEQMEWFKDKPYHRKDMNTVLSQSEESDDSLEPSIA